jgi:3-deoxy-manno-octulosonate cytidylyltransferase (CMP-KDO synthetase)
MSLPDFIVVIPARYAASRLPGKPLRMLKDKPLVEHVALRALRTAAKQVVIATDDQRIASAVEHLPIALCMTRTDHSSGTDRLAECADKLGWSAEQIVVNLQGDEPFAPIEGVHSVAQTLAASSAPMATLATPIEDAHSVFDPNVVKVARDARGNALYFSRAPIPWHRDQFAHDRLSVPSGLLRHIGIYAYRAGFLRDFNQLPTGALEQAESLEQLRVLEAGLSIAVGLSPVVFPPGVDTEEDLRKAEQRLERAQ